MYEIPKNVENPNPEPNPAMNYNTSTKNQKFWDLAECSRDHMLE